jgi:hypothetical protein
MLEKFSRVVFKFQIKERSRRERLELHLENVKHRKYEMMLCARLDLSDIDQRDFIELSHCEQEFFQPMIIRIRCSVESRS